MLPSFLDILYWRFRGTAWTLLQLSVVPLIMAIGLRVAIVQAVSRDGIVYAHDLQAYSYTLFFQGRMSMLVVIIASPPFTFTKSNELDNILGWSFSVGINLLIWCFVKSLTFLEYFGWSLLVFIFFGWLNALRLTLFKGNKESMWIGGGKALVLTAAAIGIYLFGGLVLLFAIHVGLSTYTSASSSTSSQNINWPAILFCGVAFPLLRAVLQYFSRGLIKDLTSHSTDGYERKKVLMYITITQRVFYTTGAYVSILRQNQYSTVFIALLGILSLETATRIASAYHTHHMLQKLVQIGATLSCTQPKLPGMQQQFDTSALPMYIMTSNSSLTEARVLAEETPTPIPKATSILDKILSHLANFEMHRIEGSTSTPDSLRATHTWVALSKTIANHLSRLLACFLIILWNLSDVYYPWQDACDDTATEAVASTTSFTITGRTDMSAIAFCKRGVVLILIVLCFDAVAVYAERSLVRGVWSEAVQMWEGMGVSWRLHVCVVAAFTGIMGLLLLVEGGVFGGLEECLRVQWSRVP